ncbi:RES family NAD+ phosphorylase [Bacillus zanthoxyli]|nr:RES family NAD+ phosphorylase [Bacillus zanthoxyli]
MENFESNIELISEQWHTLKEHLHDGVIEYDDFEKMIENYVFFNRFDNFFNETCNFFEVNLFDIKKIYRGVSGEVDLNFYERMIPKIEFAKGNNRMNPPGKAFLYAGILGKDKGRDNSTVKKHVVKTVLKEIRAKEHSIATICQFKINESAKNKKVINICGDSNIPQSDSQLTRYIFENAFNKTAFEIDKDKLSFIMANVYFNMFSSDKIFKPVNTDEQQVKKYEYAPFHALAKYISEKGYAGIMFRSTVHNNGTNLVLFDSGDASVVPNSMEHINTSDYL